jgi:hypothetical protein
MIRAMVTMAVLIFLVIVGVALLWKRGNVVVAVAAVFFLAGIYAGGEPGIDSVRTFATHVFNLM